MKPSSIIRSCCLAVGQSGGVLQRPGMLLAGRHPRDCPHWVSPVSQKCHVHPRPGTVAHRGHVSPLECPISTLTLLTLLVPHSPWTWHGGTHEMWRFPVPTLTSSVLSVMFTPDLALWHPGDMEVPLVSHLQPDIPHLASATSTLGVLL